MQLKSLVSRLAGSFNHPYMPAAVWCGRRVRNTDILDGVASCLNFCLQSFVVLRDTLLCISGAIGTW